MRIATVISPSQHAAAGGRRWAASWIWVPGKRHEKNYYAAFRRTFRLAAKPRRARIHVTAFTHYRLYVNGCEVGFGPNPAEPAWYYYDTYDISRHLRQGRNVVAVLACHIGDALWCDAAYARNVGGAMIAELVCRDPDRTISSDGRWKCSQATAWQQRTPSCFTDMRAAYKEYVDARDPVLVFAKPEFRASGWAQAETVGRHPLAPFIRLLPREIPHQRPQLVKPVNAYTLGFHSAYGFSEKRGWEITDPTALIKGYPAGNDLRLLMAGEGGARKDADAFNATQCRVRALKSGEHPSLLLDFGRLCAGRFRLVISDAPPAAHIDIAYGESLNMTYIDRYICREGAQAFSPYHRRVGRYVLLTFRGLKRPLTIQETSFEHMLPGMPQRGSVQGDDSRYEDIFRVSARTVAASMQDHYEDSVWREQKMYLGDLRVQALAAYYVFGAYRYTRKCIRQMARTARPDGWVSSVGPIGTSAVTIIDFPAHFVTAVRDYVMHAGDRALAQEIYPVVVNQLDNYAALPHVNGLIDIGYEPSFEWFCFIDWNRVEKQGIVAPLAMWVLDAFAAGAQLAALLGRRSDAEQFAARAAAYRKQIDRAFWNPGTRLYADAIARGRRINHASVETNALALYTGVARGDRRKAVLHRFTERRWHATTPFFETFVVEALLRAGQYRTGWEYLAEYWGNMIERGADTFWEVFDLEALREAPRTTPHKIWSLCHGWSSGPAYLLGAYLLGIVPREPGFAAVSVQPLPAPVGSLSGTVPTPRGNIHISLNREKRLLDLRVPKGIEVTWVARFCNAFSDIRVNGR